MCRVSSPSGLVPINPDLFLARSSHESSRILPTAVPWPLQSAANESQSTSSSPAIKKRKSILRKSTYQYDCQSTPRLVSVNNDITLSRESSTDSFKSSCGEDDSATTVSFLDKVLVQEFRRLPGEEMTTWYTPEEMKAFQKEVSCLIHQYERQQHRQWISFFLTRRTNRIMHSHPALAASVEDDDYEGDNQVKKILLVDSHDLSLRLFASAVSLAFPFAVVVTAMSSQDAIDRCDNSSYSFDIVIVEERLSLFRTGSQTDSGSELIKVLRKRMPRGLFIGVCQSTRNNCEQANLKKSGADLCWSKPAPPLNKSTLDEIFKTLGTKRNTN